MLKRYLFFLILSISVYSCSTHNTTPTDGGDHNHNNKTQDSSNVVADDHNYRVVFPDDWKEPHFLYFIGFVSSLNQEMVWKYDLKKDTLVADYPKKVADVFNLPHLSGKSKKFKIMAGGWLHFDDIDPKTQLFFFGNGHYCRYDLEADTAGILHPTFEIASSSAPDLLQGMDCVFYCPARKASYFFMENGYQKILSNRDFKYKSEHSISNVWGLPSVFIARGLSGICYFADSRTGLFFSGDECVTYDEGTLTSDDIRMKITDRFPGL